MRIKCTQLCAHFVLLSKSYLLSFHFAFLSLFSPSLFNCSVIVVCVCVMVVVVLLFLSVFFSFRIYVLLFNCTRFNIVFAFNLFHWNVFNLFTRMFFFGLLLHLLHNVQKCSTQIYNLYMHFLYSYYKSICLFVCFFSCCFGLLSFSHFWYMISRSFRFVFLSLQPFFHFPSKTFHFQWISEIFYLNFSHVRMNNHLMCLSIAAYDMCLCLCLCMSIILCLLLRPRLLQMRVCYFNSCSNSSFALFIDIDRGIFVQSITTLASAVQFGMKNKSEFSDR